MKLKNKVALITGAGASIGKAIALGFAKEGAHVAVNDINPDNASSVAAEIKAFGQESEVYIADVSEYESVVNMADLIIDTFGRIDILVNNAGVLSSAPFLELSVLEFKRIMDINVSGVFYVSQAVARAMVTRGKGGAILNISSLNAWQPFFDTAHYNASKASVSMLTQSMALELAAHGIRVNEICPASTETEINREALQDPENRRARQQTVPLGRIGQPQDLVGGVIFLCSDDASWITGASLAVNGGLGLVPPFGPQKYGTG